MTRFSQGEQARFYPAPARITTMIGELTVASPKFAHRWAPQNIGVKLYGHKHLRHPDCGAFEIAYVNLEIPGTAGIYLNCYVPEPPSTPPLHSSNCRFPSGTQLRRCPADQNLPSGRLR